MCINNADVTFHFTRKNTTRRDSNNMSMMQAEPVQTTPEPVAALHQGTPGQMAGRSTTLRTALLL